MTTNITKCSYSKDGTNSVDLTQPQLDQLKTETSDIISRISKVYLQYTGDKIYNMTLKNDSVVFELVDKSEKKELKLNGTKWELICGTTTTPIADDKQVNVGQDIARALERISNAATAALPAAAAGSSTAPGSTSDTRGTVINLNINGERSQIATTSIAPGLTSPDDDEDEIIGRASLKGPLNYEQQQKRNAPLPVLTEPKVSVISKSKKRAAVELAAKAVTTPISFAWKAARLAGRAAAWAFSPFSMRNVDMNPSQQPPAGEKK